MAVHSWRHSSLAPPVGTANLSALAAALGVPDTKACLRAVHKLPAARQQALLDNAAEVAAYLQVRAAFRWVGG